MVSQKEMAKPSNHTRTLYLIFPCSTCHFLSIQAVMRMTSSALLHAEDHVLPIVVLYGHIPWYCAIEFRPFDMLGLFILIAV